MSGLSLHLYGIGWGTEIPMCFKEKKLKNIETILRGLEIKKSDKIYYIFSWIMFLLELCWNYYYYVVFCNNDLIGLITYGSALVSLFLLPIAYVAINFVLIIKNKINKLTLIFLFILRVISPGTLLLFYGLLFHVCVNYFS